MQPFQGLKNTLLLLKRDFLAVIFHSKLPPRAAVLARYLDRRRFPRSTDGVTWTTSTAVTGQSSGQSPALAVIANPNVSTTPFTTYNLITVYVSNSGTDDLLVTTSADGVHWKTNTEI